MEDFVTLRMKGAIAEISFGTSKSNALPGVILSELEAAIMRAGETSAKAILLKSEGEKAFCAGASFDELLEIEQLESSKIFFMGFAKVLLAMRNCGKIVIVRVQGKTTGGGVGIACAADYCFATKDAAMALTEINLGIGPFVIGPFVQRKIGVSAFSAMMIDAEFRSAEWCRNQGIYQHVFDNISEMDTAIDEFLGKISERSADALNLMKKISWENTGHFEALMPERALMSATLLLEPEAKKNIGKIKQKLSEKKS